MGKDLTIPWWEADDPVKDLPTAPLGTETPKHEVKVQREAIPLIFVPGIMGTCLRRSGTDGSGNGSDGLPNMRWNPSSSMWMLKNYFNAGGGTRKKMIVGRSFDPAYLEPDNANPVGDGFRSLMQAYRDDFLEPLRNHDWGQLSKVFEFPVYGFGYNWTDSAANAGKKLAARIKEIKAEAAAVTGLCEKVILISHSMGGLVTRWASEKEGASGDILGIIHGVQPSTGSPAAYWRIKGGFEGSWIEALVLGISAREVTPILGNIPGGLQLLPNKLHKTNEGRTSWLTVTENGVATLELPKSDPYQEIYREPAKVAVPAKNDRPSTNKYWGLVDPDLLDPDAVPASGGNQHDAAAAAMAPDVWSTYLTLLDIAEKFHDALGKSVHTHTFNARGVGKKTADVIELRVESNWVRSDPYPNQCFRGFFRHANGDSMQAVLQDPAGDGDATVPRSSGGALDKKGKQLPGDRAIEAEHQPAYKEDAVHQWGFEAVKALAKVRYEERNRKIGDFPAPEK